MRKALGFTLIEIMVVMLIAGIILSFVMLSLGDFGQSRKLSHVTKHLSHLIEHVRIKAIIESKTYGLHIQPAGYRFYQFSALTEDKPARWQALDKHPLLTFSSFPRKTHVNLNLTAHKNTPEIIIDSSGHITAFKLQLNNQTGDKFTIRSDSNGKVSFRED